MLLHLFGANTAGKTMQELRAMFFARIDNALASLLRGCWHTNMLGPIRLGGHSYRVCVGCGIKRLFDEQTLVCYGRYGYDVQRLAAEETLNRRSQWGSGGWLSPPVLLDATINELRLSARSGACCPAIRVSLLVRDKAGLVRKFAAYSPRRPNREPADR